MARFGLAAVHAAARYGRVRGGGLRFKDRLMPYVSEYVQMIAFTESVLLEIREIDFMKTHEYGEMVKSCGSGLIKRRPSRASPASLTVS